MSKELYTHSPYATTFAALGEPIPASHYLVAFAGTEIPVARYETHATPELGTAATEALGDDYNANAPEASRRPHYNRFPCKRVRYCTHGRVLCTDTPTSRRQSVIQTPSPMRRYIGYRTSYRAMEQRLGVILS